MVEVVQVLQVDRALGYRIPPPQLERAEMSSTARVLRLPSGRWEATKNADDARDGAGLLILSGAMVRRAGREGNFGAELLAAGDVIRPWQYDGDAAGTLLFETTWRVIAPVRLAVLDVRWMGRMAAWPTVAGELVGRALERSMRLATLLAIAQQRRLDTRLTMLLWKLADRFGVVTRDGVELQLPLTHEVLAHLAAARRPSVSATIGKLTQDGVLRHDRRRWLLLGSPPDGLEDEIALSVS